MKPELDMKSKSKQEPHTAMIERTSIKPEFKQNLTNRGRLSLG